MTTRPPGEWSAERQRRWQALQWPRAAGRRVWCVPVDGALVGQDLDWDGDALYLDGRRVPPGTWWLYGPGGEGPVRLAVACPEDLTGEELQDLHAALRRATKA